MRLSIQNRASMRCPRQLKKEHDELEFPRSCWRWVGVEMAAVTLQQPMICYPV